MHARLAVLVLVPLLGLSAGCAGPARPRLHSVPLPAFAGDFRVVGERGGQACPERIERVTDGAIFLLEYTLQQRQAPVPPRPLGDYRPERPEEGGLQRGEWVRVDCENLVSLAVLQVR